MVVGSVSGFGMQMMNNALQKVPLSRSELRFDCLISSLLWSVCIDVRHTVHETSYRFGYIDVGYTD